MAKEKNIKVISITDHDNIDGSKKLVAVKNDKVYRYSGVELTAKATKGRMHIVGLNIDLDNIELNDTLKEMKELLEYCSFEITSDGGVFTGPNGNSILFPFSGQYNKFTFDQTKKAYVANNLISTVVDENDITQTYELYTKTAEVTFVNGYLNTVTIEMCDDNTFENVYLNLVFTFSDINNTTVELQ